MFDVTVEIMSRTIKSLKVLVLFYCLSAENGECRWIMALEFFFRSWSPKRAIGTEENNELKK